MMKKKKLILFDWGHVIQNGSSNKCTVEYAREMVCRDMKPTNYSKFMKIFDLNDFWTLNNNNFKAFITNSLIQSGSTKNYDDFVQSYFKQNGKIPYFEDTIKLIESIQNMDNCYIGILSNISELDIVQLKEHLNLNKFDYLFLLAYTGIQKPNNMAYINVEKKVKVPANNILFIDDSLENIKAANKRGWKTCLATGNNISKIKIEISAFLK